MQGEPTNRVRQEWEPNDGEALYGLGNHQHVGGDRYALLRQSLDLCLQRPWIEHYAVADDGRRAAHNSRRKQR